MGECWCWLLRCDKRGYGRITIRVKEKRNPHGFFVHRVAWELFNGPIPSGMTLDHVAGICTHTSCWRLDHMEIVPKDENTRRARAYQRQLEQQA